MRPRDLFLGIGILFSACGDQAPLDGEPVDDRASDDTDSLDTVDTTSWSDSTPSTDAAPRHCLEAEERLGQRVCVHSVESLDTWQGVTLPGSTPGTARLTKYLSPASDDAPLDTLFMDANVFTMHYDLISRGFPDLYPALEPLEYYDLITLPGQRTYFAGTIFEVPAGDPRFGFTVIDDPAKPDGTISFEGVTRLHRDLSAGFRLGDLAFYPETQAQIDAARLWEADFVINGVSGN